MSFDKNFILTCRIFFDILYIVFVDRVNDNVVTTVAEIQMNQVKDNFIFYSFFFPSLDSLDVHIIKYRLSL